MEKYIKLLKKIVEKGKAQKNKKGDITYLANEKLVLSKAEIIRLFANYKVAKIKLAQELEMYKKGETEVAAYKEVGIDWWDYCAPNLINTYPSYFKYLPKLIIKINKEKRNSKNYVLFIGANAKKTNQLPCLSLIQFQIDNGKLIVSVYQRSADCNLGLPSDIYQMFLVSQMINIPLKEICFFIGNAHIYNNNLDNTKKLILSGEKGVFNLNV